MKDLQRDKSIADAVQKQMSIIIAGNRALQKVVAVQTMISQHRISNSRNLCSFNL